MTDEISTDAAAGRLERQIAFLFELDKLKLVERRTYLSDESRHENSAEHSWHLALLALVLSEHANEPLDLFRVIKMLLVHDIVEIDAGDTYTYDEAASQTKQDREQRAAERLFGLLPADQAQTLRAWWDEFEAGQSAEAKFANALDRFQPVTHNLITRGRAWREHGIHATAVVARNQHIAAGSVALWERVKGQLEAAVGRGDLPA